MHVLFLSPSSNLPTIVNQDSATYVELSMMGYTPLKFGTKRELQSLEEELMQDFAMELELNNSN